MRAKYCHVIVLRISLWFFVLLHMYINSTAAHPSEGEVPDSVISDRLYNSMYKLNKKITYNSDEKLTSPNYIICLCKCSF